MGTDIILPNRADDNVIELSMSIIYSKIYEIRGYKVMLDYELAEIYKVETAQLKRAVRRNIKRFEDSDFMFELTKREIVELSRCQIGILNKGRGSNIKHPPFAFTELGVAMLSSVLNSDYAIEENKKIMRAFIAIRKYAFNYAELKHELETYMNKTDRKIDDIYNILDAFLSEKEEEDKPRNPIGFKQKN